MNRSNCIKWARAEYERRICAWISAGRPVGAEPYLVRRPTRLRIQPRWWFPEVLCNWITDRIPHFLVGTPSYWGDLSMESYAPTDRAYSLSPLCALRVLAFSGHVVAQDWPSTVPTKPVLD